MGLRIRNVRGKALGLFAGLLAGTVLLGTAVAITSNTFTYTEPKTGFLSIHPGTFVPDRIQNPTNDYEHNYGSVETTQGVGTRCFAAPVHLPQGADIKRVKYFFTTNQAPSIGVGGFLRIANLATGNTQSVAGGDFPNSSGVRSSMTHSVPAAQQTVDNQTYAYAVTYCLTGERSFGGVRIQYKYFNAGD